MNKNLAFEIKYNDWGRAIVVAETFEQAIRCFDASGFGGDKVEIKSITLLSNKALIAIN